MLYNVSLFSFVSIEKFGNKNENKNENALIRFASELIKSCAVRVLTYTCIIKIVEIKQ